MASHASALKAHRQSLKNREHNRQFRSRLRTALKDVRTAIDGKNLAGAKDALRKTISLIDKMASKGIIHRNAAGRYKSRLQSRIAKRAPFSSATGVISSAEIVVLSPGITISTPSGRLSVPVTSVVRM